MRLVHQHGGIAPDDDEALVVRTVEQDHQTSIAIRPAVSLRAIMIESASGSVIRHSEAVAKRRRNERLGALVDRNHQALSTTAMGAGVRSIGSIVRKTK
jgi:hypothetical protein